MFFNWNNDDNYFNDYEQDMLSNNYNSYEIDTRGSMYEQCGMSSNDAAWSMINNYDEEY